MSKTNKEIKKTEKMILPLMSDYPSRREWENACWQKIMKLPTLLPLLVTSYERRNIVRRAGAIDGITSGKSYREIGKELWLSPQTVSGIKKAMREKGYRSYAERSKTERKKRKYGPRIITIKPKPARPSGIPHRTKYGTIYL